jgi:hypothetical protein
MHPSHPSSVLTLRRRDTGVDRDEGREGCRIGSGLTCGFVVHPSFVGQSGSEPELGTTFGGVESGEFYHGDELLVTARLFVPALAP